MNGNSALHLHVTKILNYIEHCLYTFPFREQVLIKALWQCYKSRNKDAAFLKDKFIVPEQQQTGSPTSSETKSSVQNQDLIYSGLLLMVVNLNISAQVFSPVLDILLFFLQHHFALWTNLPY